MGMTFKRVSMESVGVAARGARKMAGAGGSDTDMKLVGDRLLLWSRLSPWKQEIRKRLEAAPAGALSIPPVRRQDVVEGRQIARRKAEADEWIKAVKARKSTGVPIKSGLREGQRIAPVDGRRMLTKCTVTVAARQKGSSR